MKFILKTTFLLIIAFTLKSCVTSFKLFEKDGKLLGVLPLIDGKVVYQERIATADMPREEVFRRARRWWVDNYKSAKDVFQVVDKETGEIVGKGYGRVSYKSSAASIVQIVRLYHTISVDVFDDSYVVTVKGLEIEPQAAKPMASLAADNIPVERYDIGTVKSATALFHSIDENTLLTIQSLKKYIKKPSALPQASR